MTPADLAALHGRCFTVPRPWSAEEIAALLDTPGSFLLTRPHAFLIGRVIADEAELLTLATDPATRRQGFASALCRNFTQQAADRGAATGFLEVAADNTAALALYQGLGWQAAGRRKSYYAPGVDGVVMRLNLAEMRADPQDLG
ncbi:MAG: GNAT family N-acetyltransferase [Paracoccus sp. (in: a-proteobacteria)]|uniref:GNAT family N-acetyltransferase n=1 Tax=Paracoccus sp. TaxID=267 RepID=UPI0026E0DEE3|nr:GNAT family N-acetyltransferase [Paracoccus sp. (in: a-proteobacteria)]MDO5620452.1 GNAT family N-acetyltransferase [Paracoccus sp. (in: a-proteobacteria)]